MDPDLRNMLHGQFALSQRDILVRSPRFRDRRFYEEVGFWVGAAIADTELLKHAV
jgi:hypothetical protein